MGSPNDVLQATVHAVPFATRHVQPQRSDSLPLRTILLTFFWTLLGLVVVAAAAWHLAFQRGDEPASEVNAPIMGQATVSWIDGPDAVISLSSAQDGETALGVAHALERPWLMALYRQAALGRLSEWFGSETVALDRHVKQLGIPDVAPEALDSQTRLALQRYAAGVRAGQSAQSWDLLPAAVAAGFSPEPWKEGHTLAVERLFSWLSTVIVAGDSLGTAPFEDRRDSLAAFLGLTDLDQAVVWATEADGLYARLPVGNSGLPPIMSVAISVGQRLVYEGATLPGLPYRFCGRSETDAWCKPLTSTATVAPDSAVVRAEYFAIDLADGSRAIGTQQRTARGLVDNGAHLEWPGLFVQSDAAAWTRMPSPGAFELATTSGLVLSPTGLRILGSASVQVGSVLATGSADGIEALVARIDAVDDTLTRPEYLLLDTGSILTSARSSVAPGQTLPGADSLSGFPVTDPGSLSYVRNWDGRFSSSSIAATLYDATAAFGSAANDSLLGWFGSDRRDWRWELDPLLRLQYPGAEVGDLPIRYGEVEWRRNGHPTAPSWGPSRSFEPGRTTPFSAAWEAYLGRPQVPSAVRYRRPTVPYRQFLGRSRAAPVRTDLTSLSGRPITSQTRIRPTG